MRGELIERLRAKERRYPSTGSGYISSDGQCTVSISDDGFRLINPDGPEAADQIAAMQEEITRLRAEKTPSFERCVERVFQVACNEFAKAARLDGAGLSRDNVFFLATQAIKNTWPEVIEAYTREDVTPAQHGGWQT